MNIRGDKVVFFFLRKITLILCKLISYKLVESLIVADLRGQVEACVKLEMLSIRGSNTGVDTLTDQHTVSLTM